MMRCHVAKNRPKRTYLNRAVVGDNFVVLAVFFGRDPEM